MIKYNNNTINDWYYGASNLIKVYRNNAIVFYKVSGESPTPEYKVCFAVVDDITQYQETEFEDVYDNATDKWYKLNNLNQYEEYGVYGSGRAVTTYNGKLTIDGDYEYEWNGSSWVNVGEVSGNSKTSDFKIGDIKERVTTGISDGDYLLFSYYNKSDISKPENIMSYNPSNNYLSNLSGYGITTLDSTTIIDPSIWIVESTTSANTFYIKSIKNNLYWGYQSRVSTRSLNLVDSSSSQKAPVLITPSCKENCYGFVEKKSNASTGYGGYGLNQLNGYTYQLNWWNNGSSNVPCTFFAADGNADFIIYKMNASDAEYPKYYTEKSDPLNDLTFNTLAEAQAYAYNNCVYDGMKATIDGDRYYFDSEDENGWVKILEYYKVEDVTPSGGSGWTISGSSTYNPDSTYYDDFDLEATSTSNVTKIAKITIYGYDHFTYYLRTSGYSNYCYAVATNVDEIQTPPASMSYNSSSAITNTYYWGKSPKSDVNLSNYRRVTYNNLDKTVEHTFYVYFYGRKYSSYVGNATILIPKEQTNENWEQVTFSASSNVASIQKNLYIDGNYSNSGGTQYWYYRWMIGLPSGSHSSYTNYSSYDYCPNTTSSTFTSVASEQRQVNFTYDNTASKNLSFRLTDGSNVLTPSNSVYYGMTLYNSCNSSVSTVLTFPIISFGVKVGGSFSFGNSSNRHYIYGYQPPTLGTRYYVDNYSSTFDIVYTKLSEEAVTIAYATYDPNDSEILAFNTDITYPYSGGTTSSTTLTSFDVPYTYPYTVKQTNDKFSADKQSYTANQAARTISFILYPDNREFATVADMEAYAYAWEGMTAYVGSDKYVYKNGEWVYIPPRLPLGYTEVEYVENTGTSYFNTNFTPNQDTRVVCDMQLITASNFPRLWGAGAWNSANGLMINYEGGYLRMSWLGKTSWTNYTSVPTSFDRKVYDVNKNYLYVDSVQIGSNTYTTRTASDPIGVFTYIGSGRPSSSSYWGQEHFKGKMFSFQIYDNGTLVRDLVPCIRDNDNEVGAYDIVNDVFYIVPSGYTTDKLVAGPSV